MNTQNSQEIHQTILERINLYVNRLNGTKAYTLDRFDAITIFYQYLLTPEVKAILGTNDEAGIKARNVLRLKTEVYMNELCTRYWVCQAFPFHGETLLEMLKFLNGAPNENWLAPLRRSERIRHNFIERYNQSLKPSSQSSPEYIEFYAEFAANTARLAELKGSVPHRPSITIKVLPRRSARLASK
jgi:hypothetical protein